MKKTIPTTLSGTLFYIEEDAYDRLSEYLNSIKNHFASYADSAEIVSDIESRIAEQFLEKKKGVKTQENIVTMAEVESLIASMGNVEEISSEEDNGEKKSTKSEEIMKKKLFRNPDDVIVAGVASGLAAYLGIDPTLVRLLFVVVVLFGGSGILIYLILWFIVPEAKTSTEKLQMRGERVTLESVKEMAKEKITEVKKQNGAFRKAISLPFAIIRKIAETLLPIFRKLIGFFIALFSGMGVFIALFAFFVVIFNLESSYVDFPLFQIGNPFLFYSGMTAVFMSLLIPAFFLMFLGIIIFRKKNAFHSVFMFSLLGLWLLSIITVGVIGVKLAPEYQNYFEASPLYQKTTTEFPLAGFTGVSAMDGSRVDVTQGDTFKVTGNGTVRSMQDLSLEIKDGVLQIKNKRDFKICLFCGDGMAEISIVMPKVDSLSALNGSRLTATGPTADKLSIKITNGSSMNTSELIAQNVTIVAENGSSAKIYAGKTLQADLQNGSSVTYDGNPTIEKKVSNGSRLQKKSTDESN